MSRFKPQLEELENRLVPSSAMVGDGQIYNEELLPRGEGLGNPLVVRIHVYNTTEFGSPRLEVGLVAFHANDAAPVSTGPGITVGEVLKV